MICSHVFIVRKTALTLKSSNGCSLISTHSRIRPELNSQCILAEIVGGVRGGGRWVSFPFSSSHATLRDLAAHRRPTSTPLIVRCRKSCEWCVQVGGSSPSHETRGRLHSMQCDLSKCQLEQNFIFWCQTFFSWRSRERKTAHAPIANVGGRMESFLYKLFTLLIQVPQQMHCDRAP